jgi:acyl-coenzyme A thioesterase PaaI-like protein
MYRTTVRGGEMERWSQADLEGFNARMLEQRFHAWMGISLVSQAPGAAVCRMAVDENTDGGGGYLHGAIGEAALDVAAWFASIPLTPKGHWIRTSSAQYQLMRTALRGHQIELRATVDRAGRTTIFVRAEAWGIDEQGERALLITGQIQKAIVAIR